MLELIQSSVFFKQTDNKVKLGTHIYSCFFFYVNTYYDYVRGQVRIIPTLCKCVT